jgi:16S rRNA (guanine527-N7)-methyltransferase
MLAWFQDAWPSIGELLLIKGSRWPEERGEARHRGVLKPLELRVASTYLTPITGAENVILRLWPKAAR